MRAVKSTCRAFSYAMEQKNETRRVLNLSAGCAALPLEVLEKAQREFLTFQGDQISVSEMGYRTRNFHVIMERAEELFREVNRIPDDYELHFFNGGATLQFAALPMNLMTSRDQTANYIMTGHWSEKARNEAKMFARVNETYIDKTDLYFSLPEPKTWKFDPNAVYSHYTAADTRQGFEFQEFPYDVIPKNQILCCDASANFGSKPWDISKYGVIYAAAHKNFSTSGVCYTIIRRDLIKENVLPGTPTMCNWWKFQTSPNKIYNVPVLFAVWLGQLMCEWMIAKGGLEYFEDLAIRRSNLLYDYIDNSNFYRTFVTDRKYRSRMNVVFTIRDGEGKNAELVAKFLDETTKKGWLDIRSHPLGISSDAIRVTMYNPQPIEVIEEIREFLSDFQKRNMSVSSSSETLTKPINHMPISSSERVQAHIHMKSGV